MSNLGLETYLADRGLPLHRTKVGDRYVVEKMRAGGFNLGGEQSGHIIMTDFGTTGDGLLAALQVLAVLLKKNRPVSEVARPFRPLPQKLSNVRIKQRIDLAAPAIERLIKESQARLGRKGRLLVRASGTEPLIRVMVEAEDEALLTDILGSVSGAIESYAASS
jgi:phosphoglucosamine mutase